MFGCFDEYGQYEGNEGPWFHRLPKSKSLVVNAGLPSEGTPVVSERVAGYDKKIFKDFPLNVSIAKTNSKKSVGDDAGVKDYCDSLKKNLKLNQRVLSSKLSKVAGLCSNTVFITSPKVSMSFMKQTSTPECSGRGTSLTVASVTTPKVP